MYKLYILIFGLFVGFIATNSAYANRLQLDGNFTQGGIAIGHTAGDAKVNFDGRDLRVSNDGVFIIGFHRDDIGIKQLNIKFKDGHIETRGIEIKPRQFNIQRINGLAPAQVSPQKSPAAAAILKRIGEDSALIKAARLIDRDKIWFLDQFIWPARGKISGVYGSQRILNGIAKSPHYGVDIAANAGDQVIAPASGVIVVAHPDMYYSGGTILLDHGHGLMSAFLHMQSLSVVEGQFINQGDKLGTIGATGRATGAHLDWRMNWFNKRIDPQLLINDSPE